MATGGAWQSEVFDVGRHYQKPVQCAQKPVQYATDSDTPEAMYKVAPATSAPAADRGAFGALALALRVTQILLTLIAFSIMAANKQTIYSSYYSYYYSYSYSTIKFSNVKAFVGVLAVNCIVFLYAIGQLVQAFVNMASKGSFVSSATTVFAVLTFVSDTVLAYCLVAAAGAGADSVSVLLDGGYGSYNKFIQMAQASVAMSFLAFFALAASAALFPIRLRKLATSSAS